MKKFAMALKLGVIGIVTLLISIALFMVNGTIGDRQNFRNDAIRSIESSYAGPQSIIGPVLVRPYSIKTATMENDGNGGKKRVERTSQLNAISFPHTLDVTGKLTPSSRRHGLYSVTVYEFAGHIQGGYDIVPPTPTLDQVGDPQWGQPYLALSVDDVRGIVGTPSVTVDGSPQTMLQGADAIMGWQPNLRVPLRSRIALANHLDFAIDMDLGGTEQFSIAPVADSNHVALASTWPSPLFAGQFLPRTRSVSATGFTAAWDVSSLATGTQMQMQASPTKPIDLLTVSLLTPIDPYKLSDRATKYGILFILLTFGGFFLFEMLKSLPIHPIQYLLVGFGLAIFFLLLISFSEHMPFALAYLISSAACIGLLTFYLAYVLRSTLRALSFGAMLTALYAAVYGLLISEDNALVLGSLLLFAVLAIVMVITRNVDWYKTNPLPTPLPPTQPTPPPTPPTPPATDFTTIRLTH